MIELELNDKVEELIMTIVVLYGGNRPNGNTELLTKKAIQGLIVEEINISEGLFD